jgi:subtilisin family serine protease
LWGLKNTGQSFGTPGADIKAEQAWDLTTGNRGIVVAVNDEGIDVNHQDLQANIWRSPGEVAGNSFDDDGNGYVDDVSGYDFFHNDGSVYSNMSLIIVGFYHMAAMGPNANLWIWGSNTYGQIGDGSMLQRNPPVPLDFFSTGPTVHYT